MWTVCISVCFITDSELDSGHGPRVDALKWSFKREWRREHEEAIRALQRKFEDELDRMKHYYDKKIVSFGPS
jgi:hypothetical protein